jgi:hypothetical protein
MASEQELHRVARDLVQVRIIAGSLLRAYAPLLTDWEADFLEDMNSKTRVEPLSYRQVEKLLQIRDSYHVVSTYRGLSLSRILKQCYEARLDLSESDEEFVVNLHMRQADSVRSRDVPRLLRCAHSLGLVEDHTLVDSKQSFITEQPQQRRDPAVGRGPVAGPGA